MSAPERAVERAAGPSWSTTSVSIPSSARWKAMFAPTTPAPTTIASGTALQPRGCVVEVGDAALYGRLFHRLGDPLVDVRVECVWCEVRLGFDRGEGFGGGELHG